MVIQDPELAIVLDRKPAWSPGKIVDGVVPAVAVDVDRCVVGGELPLDERLRDQTSNTLLVLTAIEQADEHNAVLIHVQSHEFVRASVPNPTFCADFIVWKLWNHLPVLHLRNLQSAKLFGENLFYRFALQYLLLDIEMLRVQKVFYLRFWQFSWQRKALF